MFSYATFERSREKRRKFQRALCVSDGVRKISYMSLNAKLYGYHKLKRPNPRSSRPRPQSIVFA